MSIRLENSERQDERYTVRFNLTPRRTIICLGNRLPISVIVCLESVLSPKSFALNVCLGAKNKIVCLNRFHSPQIGYHSAKSFA